MQQPMINPKDISDPIIVMNTTLVLIVKAIKLNYSTPTNNNQRISSNPRNRQIAQSCMNIGQDRQMQMVRVQNVRNLVMQNAVQNLGVQNVGNQNRLIVVLGIANPNANHNVNGNVIAAWAEGNGNANNGNQIRCYNCKGMGHLAMNCTVRPR
ncbi:retrovirus-related pol polyprotein from transposon TNT 1-94 [Tanacetum coccineum]